MSKKPTPHTAIAAGLANPEDQVEVPRRTKSTSFNAQVTELDTGEVATKAELIPSSLTLAEVATVVAAKRQAIRNNMTKVVQRARETTGGEYTLEVTDTITAGGNWFVVGLITRIG